jgi:hypothetical protein
MDKFSEAFDQAKSSLTAGVFAGDVETMRPGLGKLFGADGLDAAEAAQLAKLRFTLDTAKKALVTGGKGSEEASADAIIAASGDSSGKPDRAATLKMLSHLYHTKSVGGQAIWVYSPPKIYTKWIFDEVAGATDQALKAVLRKPADEVYSPSQRELMSDALQTARKVCLDAVVKLSSPNTATVAVIRRYFGNAASTDQELATVAETLRGGYQKIANACSATSVVISDEPGDRCGGGWKDWAFIYTAEAMSVIYLQGAWVSKADEATPSNQAPLFRCARTVIHELSHKQLRTEDVVYGPKGLMPEGSSALTPAYALHNADSWAYFSMDVTGNLTGPDATNGSTACTAIREVPSKTLTTT